MAGLEQVVIDQELKALPGWKFENDSLVREYQFTSFERAIAFMNACVPKISEADHHPEWINVYDKIRVRYRTHDAGNVVTDKDITMARILEDIYQTRYKTE